MRTSTTPVATWGSTRAPVQAVPASAESFKSVSSLIFIVKFIAGTRATGICHACTPGNLGRALIGATDGGHADSVLVARVAVFIASLRLRSSHGFTYRR